MLFIVLILVLAALALLVTALITALSLWAWVSIGLSVLAALVLVVDYFRRRAQRRRAEGAAEATIVEPAAESDAQDDEAAVPEEAAAEPEQADEPAAHPETGDPAEEKTSPADAEVVAKLDVEVVVVDEYPRYHVPECEWLTDRDTIPIAVKEARDLGFTPCARCTPDAKLAEAHRAAAR
ncbi:MAG TPA: hypothetical protein VHC18_10860 [Amycolatopsis sp.]|nr:hypothetical protein [Amycolatopsis sp.]